MNHAFQVDEGAALRLERRTDGQLWASADGRSIIVRVARCFPWSAPGRFISLRDTNKREFSLVINPVELDVESRAALEDALIEADFLLQITAIESIAEEIEIRIWNVQTRQGSRSFQTKRDEWPRHVPGGGVVIRDVAGDLYYVSDPAMLDARSKERLAVFID